MKQIKILDCTLRDGGYVNSWNFGEKNIKFIINHLVKTGIDYIECGFLKKNTYDKDKSLFHTFKELESYLPEQSNSIYTLMVNFGEIPIEDFPMYSGNIHLRIAFKRERAEEALDYCRQLKEKGYKIFINPMNSKTYSDKEFLNVIERVNSIKPEAFAIVDTTGEMKEREILSLFCLIENNLDETIPLCFHSHNNLQLSFSNAQILMKQITKRDIIIDSTVFGMGRGAGNLCSELLVGYINDNYEQKYDILPILKIMDEVINPIFARTPWGYSVPYYLASINHCHPNYAKYLAEKQTIPVEIINKLLELVPPDKKSTYSEELIKKIYLDNFSNKVEDKKLLEEVYNMIKDRDILILAPGKSLEREYEKIKDYIEKNNPFIISLNFIPEKFKEDAAFVTNIKRYSNITKPHGKLVVTSNVLTSSDDAIILDYSTYINNSKMFDNTALMLIKLFIKIGIKSVNFAGLDGFSSINSENYFDNNLVNSSKVEEFEARNTAISKTLRKYSKFIKMNFVTATNYEIYNKSLIAL